MRMCSVGRLIAANDVKNSAHKSGTRDEQVRSERRLGLLRKSRAGHLYRADRKPERRTAEGLDRAEGADDEDRRRDARGEILVQEHCSTARLRRADPSRRRRKHRVFADSSAEGGRASLQPDCDSKDEILKALTDSYDYGEALIREQTEQSMLQVIQTNQFLGPSSKARVIYFLIGHTWDIYGQMVVYLRLNGVTPPASQRP